MKISVLMPVYNVEKFLTQTLQSLAAQTFRDFELIAVDDCSTDRSPEILHEYSAQLPSCRIIRNSVNRHVSASRNIGLRAAQGEYIYCIDSDDWLLPDCLEKMVKVLERNPSANAVVCDSLRVDADDKPRRIWFNLLEDYYLKKNQLFRVAFGNIPCLIRKDIFFAAGLYDETLRAAVDRDIGIKMVKHINIVGIPERLYIYREHSSNITHNSAAYKNSREFQEHFRKLTKKYFTPADYINDWEQVKKFRELDADFAEARRHKYANTILKCALHLALLGHKTEALAEIKKAEFLAPEIKYSAFAVLIRLGFRNLRKFWVNMNVWFKYAYDDYYMVDVKNP